MHKEEDRGATGPMTKDGWIDAIARRNYMEWVKKGHPTEEVKEVVVKPKKERKRLTKKKEEPMGKGEKIVIKNGKYTLLPGATREDEMRLIELEIAERKAAIDSKKETEHRNNSKGEPALKLDDLEEDFEDVEEEGGVIPKAKKLKVVEPEEKKVSRAMLVFQRAMAKGKEVIDSMGDYEGYFHKHGTLVDTNKVQSFKQLVQLMTNKGAMCVEYRKGFGLHMIVGTRRYVKSCEGPSYWSKRGIDVKGLKTVKQLIQLMVKNSASKMEVREGIPKLLPDFYLNKKTKKRERSGVWIDGKGRNQIAYTAIRVQK